MSLTVWKNYIVQDLSEWHLNVQFYGRPLEGNIWLCVWKHQQLRLWKEKYSNKFKTAEVDESTEREYDVLLHICLSQLPPTRSLFKNACWNQIFLSVLMRAYHFLYRHYPQVSLPSMQFDIHVGSVEVDPV